MKKILITFFIVAILLGSTPKFVFAQIPTDTQGNVITTDLTKDQINSLNKQQLQSITPQQINTFTVPQTAALLGPQWSSLTAEQHAALNQRVSTLSSSEALDKLATDTLSKATPQQISNISPGDLAMLSPDTIKTLTPQQISALTPAQLQRLTAPQINALTPAQQMALNLPGSTSAEKLANLNKIHTDYNAQPSDEKTCGITSGAGIVVCILQGAYQIIYFIGQVILSIAAWILWTCGVLLNFSIVTFVVKMKTAVDNVKAVYVIWQTVRDLANMFFIFILLFIAIQTILQMGDYKKMLRNVVLVALFINFSFFFTGVMIDASNIVALQFYNGFAGKSCQDASTKNIGGSADGCMSQKVVDALRLGTVYSDQAPKTAGTNAGGISSSQNSLAATYVGGDLKNIGPFLITVIMGSALMIVTGGIFIASAIMVFFRFIQLIMALMFSPLAFAAIILPSTKKYFDKWWNILVPQLIFAPVYFMFLWVTMKIIQSNVLQLTKDDTFRNGFSGNALQLCGLIANYIIIIMMLSYSLVLAKELGAAGLDTATKASKGFQGIVGRNTIGRASSRIANSNVMQNFASNAKVGAIGRLVQKPFTSLAKQSFGDKSVKGGFDQAEKDYVKKQEDFAKTLSPTALQTKRAKTVQQKAEDNQILQRNLAEKTVNEKFADQETQVSPEKISAAEAELTTQKAKATELKLKASTRILNESTGTVESDEEFSKRQKEAEDAEKTVVEKQKTVETMKVQRETITKQKKEEVEKIMKPHNDRLAQADKVVGVDKEKATTRGEALGKSGKDLESFIKEQTSNNPGIGKVRQEQFAKSIEKSIFIGPAKRAAASSAIRKNVVKGKSDAEKLIESLKEEGAKKEKEKGEEKTEKAPDSSKDEKDKK